LCLPEWFSDAHSLIGSSLRIKLKEIPEYSSVMLSNKPNINAAYISFNDDKKKFKHWFNFRMKGKKVISLPLQATILDYSGTASAIGENK